jgi:hypothetical protein
LTPLPNAQEKPSLRTFSSARKIDRLVPRNNRRDNAGCDQNRTLGLHFGGAI